MRKYVFYLNDDLIGVVEDTQQAADLIYQYILICGQPKTKIGAWTTTYYFRF